VKAAGARGLTGLEIAEPAFAGQAGVVEADLNINDHSVPERSRGERNKDQGAGEGNGLIFFLNKINNE
jgi:hypothetical protein